jgi:hypothetical protein
MSTKVKKENETSGKTVSEIIREMSLVKYIANFGTILDQNGLSKTYKKRIPFKLWPRQAEMCDFIERVKFVLIPKSRQKGASETGAERALKTLMENENTEGVAISISEDVAGYFLTRRVLPKYQEMNRLFPNKFPQIVKQTKDMIEWEGGRVIRSLSSSQTAGASMTLDFLIMDECGGIDENRQKNVDTSIFKEIWTNAKPSLDQNPLGWAMLIGTSVPGSYYNQLVKEAYDANNEGYLKYFFIGWWHQPGRNAKWYEQEASALKDKVYSQHPTDMDDFFYVRDGLVFKHFDGKEPDLDGRGGGRHIYNFTIGQGFKRKLDKDVTNYRCSWNGNYITSYDHGTNHPAVNLYSVYEQYSDMLYVFAETFFHEGHGTDTVDIAKRIHERLKMYPKRPDKQIADGAIFNKIGVKSVGSIFREEGLAFTKAKKHDESASRELLSNRFRDNKILIHPDCVNLIAQIKSYRWDSKSVGDKPIQKNDDAIDALRYLCNECKPTEYKRKETRSADVGYTLPTKTFKEQKDDDNNSNWMAY